MDTNSTSPTLIDSTTTKIGWIGTGVMGKSMAGHLIAKGYKLCVHNRTKAKTDELVAQGAEYCDSPKEVA